MVTRLNFAGDISSKNFGCDASSFWDCYLTRKETLVILDLWLCEVARVAQSFTDMCHTCCCRLDIWRPVAPSRLSVTSDVRSSDKYYITRHFWRYLLYRQEVHVYCMWRSYLYTYMLIVGETSKFQRQFSETCTIFCRQLSPIAEVSNHKKM